MGRCGVRFPSFSSVAPPATLIAMKQLDPQSAAARHIAAGRYVIRHLDAAGLAAVVMPWMRAAGWNPGLHDADTFIAADPHGFLVGELDGVPIASVSAVRYDDAFGFMGCYLVEERFRGQGYGLAIHEAGRAHLAGCTQGGDGVLANVEKYQRIGRVLAYRNARYQGVKPPSNESARTSLVPATEVPRPSLEALDRRCFPAPRSAFLDAWIRQPGAHALAAVDGHDLRGYGVIRPCHQGWKIGPLFACESTVAEDLLRGLLTRIPDGDTFVLDVAEPNEAGLALACRHGMIEVFATARMYTGPFPRLCFEWVYGVTTFELG